MYCQRSFGDTSAGNLCHTVFFFCNIQWRQVPGGYIAIKYGGKMVFGVGVLMTAILTLVLPLCAPHLGALFALRAFMGLFESVTFPVHSPCVC